MSIALASSAVPLGKKVSYGEDNEVACQNLADFDFKGVDIRPFLPRCEGVQPNIRPRLLRRVRW